MSDAQPDESEQRTGETAHEWAARNAAAAEKAAAAATEKASTVVEEKGEFVEKPTDEGDNGEGDGGGDPF